MFRDIFETTEKEFFFNNDEDGIEELMDYVEDKYSDNEVELYIGRGDDYAHGCKVYGNALKDKKLMDMITSIKCTKRNPENCY